MDRNLSFAEGREGGGLSLIYWGGSVPVQTENDICESYVKGIDPPLQYSALQPSWELPAYLCCHTWPLRRLLYGAIVQYYTLSFEQYNANVEHSELPWGLAAHPCSSYTYI